MQLLIGLLFLTLAALPNYTLCNPLPSIPLPRRSTAGAQNNPRTHAIPAPFYYDAQGVIRLEGHPTFLPVIRDGFLVAMTTPGGFHPIGTDREFYAIRLRDSAIYELGPLDRHLLVSGYFTPRNEHRAPAIPIRRHSVK